MYTRQSVSSTFNVLKDTLLVATPAVVTKLAYSGIQAARQLEASDLKDQLKNTYSSVSSACSAGVMAYEASDLIFTLLSTGAWDYLNNAQRVGVIIGATLGTGAGIYSFSRIGVEHNTLWAGIAGSASVLLFATAKHVATISAQANENEEETRLLI